MTRMTTKQEWARAWLNIFYNGMGLTIGFVGIYLILFDPPLEIDMTPTQIFGFAVAMVGMLMFSIKVYPEAAPGNTRMRTETDIRNRLKQLNEGVECLTNSPEPEKTTRTRMTMYALIDELECILNEP